MKKITALILSLIICISMCACSNNTSSTGQTTTEINAKATITDNEGNVVEKT